MPRRTTPPVPDGPHVGALDLDTEVPTPAGVTTVAELAAGELVFGSDGRPVPVLQISEVITGRPCFEVEFSTGERLLVDGDQRLLTERRDLPAPATFATRRSASEVADGVAELGPNVYGIRIAPAIQLPRKKLPVEPYLLGAWLGAGVLGTPAIRDADDDLLRCLTDAGVRVFTSGLPGQHWVGVPGRICRGADLGTRLRQLEVLEDKHLPMPYLRSSEEQRRELLAGLLDAAAVVSSGGEVVFRAESAVMAIGVHQLIASLGFRPWFRPGRGVVDIAFVTGARVFSRARLQRQLQARQRLTANLRPRRLVTSVAQKPSRPVRRVRVATDDGLLLVGRSFIPLPGACLETAEQVSSPA